LLKQIGFDFKVIVSETPETIQNGIPPEQLVMNLSLDKAKDVAQNLDSGLVIGADTIVVLQGKILGKPADYKEAVSMLQYLSGNTHQVYTGFTLLDAETDQKMIDYECTKVTFRSLSKQEIEEYIKLEPPFDKAGAYGIQDRSALFVEKIDGCYYNVVGFPLAKFYVNFKKFLA
jgi:septum formation protein